MASTPTSFAAGLPRPTGASDTILAKADFLSAHRQVLIETPLRIVLIIVIALIVRGVINRFITRMTTPHRGETPRILRPLKEKVESSALAVPVLSERRVQRAATIGSVLRSFVTFVVFTLALLLVLSELKFDLAPFIAGTSIVGVALGFGAQNIVKDFLSGIFMLLEDQYGVGDVIDFQLATGIVEAVGLRSTRLRDANGVIWYVRNGEVLRVGNKTQTSTVLTLDIPIGPADDLKAASSAIESAATELAQDPDWVEIFEVAPVVQGVQDMTHEATYIRVVATVAAANQYRTARELRTRIRARFDADHAARFGAA